MRKHIKIKAKYLGNDKVELTLLAQSHFGSNFGIDYSEFVAASGVRICSIGEFIDTSYFEWDSILFVPDTTKWEQYTHLVADKNIVSLAGYKKIKQSILEYNSREFRE